MTRIKQLANGAIIDGLTISVKSVLSVVQFSVRTGVERTVQWKSTVAPLQNKPIRLRVEMQNADLFSMQFGERVFHAFRLQLGNS